MKKIIVVLIIGIIMISISLEEEKVIIPEESIRFRVIADSNEPIDQTEKQKVALVLGKNVTELLKDKNSLQEARKTLKKNINNFSNIIEEELKKDDYQKEVNVNFGMNYFPQKNYKGVTYKEGEYESLVVTLGKGEGKNFWCVLFPPLCLLEAEEKQTKDIEYTSFVKEIIDKYF